MTNLIILDTNILISLGINLENNIDFIGIKDYCYSSGSEILVTKTIKNEYLDFNRTKILERNIDDLNQVYDKLKRLKHFESFSKPDLSNNTNLQLAEINHFLNQYYKEGFEEYWLSKDELLGFLLDNKKENKKDNTRDYLIWRNVLDIASKIEDDQVILISNDKIFSSNDFLQRMKKEKGLKNIEHFDSIASFLSIYGFRSNKLNKDLVLNSIPENTIKNELLEHKDSILSYISKFYWHSNFRLEIENLEIKGLEVVSLYAHKDQETKLINVTTNVRVNTKMIFKPDPRLEDLKIYLADLYSINSNHDYYANTFDKEGRPIFDDSLLFIISFIYEEKSNNLTKMVIHDFVPPPPKYNR